MCTGNRADSQSISKCAHGKFSESGVSIGLPRRPRPREGDNQGRNTSYTESTVKVWYRSWYSSGLLCSFVINKLKTLREPHSLSLALYSIYTDSTRSISIHHSQSSQSISIYDREIGAKISVSVSISRFLRLHTLLYDTDT